MDVGGMQKRELISTRSWILYVLKQLPFFNVVLVFIFLFGGSTASLRAKKTFAKNVLEVEWKCWAMHNEWLWETLGVSTTDGKWKRSTWMFVRHALHSDLAQHFSIVWWVQHSSEFSLSIISTPSIRIVEILCGLGFGGWISRFSQLECIIFRLISDIARRS